MKITMKVFFRKIRITGKEYIPNDGPLLILANHPSMLMDPVIIAAIVNRRVSFLAKGALFQSTFSKWFLPKLGLIPLHRVQDDPAQLSKNASTFKKCFDHFSEGGSIVMFPEGVSITSRVLQPLKPGAAKMALTAEQKFTELNLNILVIGLNYANQHKFNRDLYITIQPPINVKAFADDSDKTGQKTADALTEKIRATLESAIISVADEKTDKMIRQIEVFYKHHLVEKRGIEKLDPATDFEITRNIIKAVKDFYAIAPEKAENLSQRVDTIIGKMESVGIDPTSFDSKINDRKLSKTQLISGLFYLIISFPIYIYGLINNYLAFQIPDWTGNTFKDKDMKGSVGMVVGMFTFIIFYTLQIILVQHYLGIWWLTVLYGLSLPTTGFFAYYYWYSMLAYGADWHLIRLHKSKKNMMQTLQLEHAELISELDKIRDEFLSKLQPAV